MRPRYIPWMHGVGVFLSVAALIIGGLHNPAIGFPLAVIILIALEVPAPQSISDRKILRIIYGSIRGGGIRRGIFITEMFTAAVLLLAVRSFHFGMREAGLSNMVLGIGLAISCVASEIGARRLKRGLKS